MPVYDASHIRVLSAAAAVRRRPGMYIGSTEERGLHHMVFAMADRAASEVLAGRATRVEVALASDGAVRVTDDRSGPHTTGELEAALNIIDYGARGGDRRDVLSTVGGSDACVVNALSSRLVAEVWQDGQRWSQEYACGVAVPTLCEEPPCGEELCGGEPREEQFSEEPPSVADPATSAPDGTTITFWPDAEIFTALELSRDALADHFRTLSLLNRSLDITLTDERRTAAEPQSERFHFPDGLRAFVALLDGLPPESAAFSFEQDDERMAGTIDVALRWHAGTETVIRSFANCRPTPGGGTHEVGLRRGVETALNACARDHRLLTPTDPDLTFAELSRGLTAVISVKLDRVDFEGCTRDVLGTGPVRACVEQAVHDHLSRWLKEFPEQAATATANATGQPS